MIKKISIALTHSNASLSKGIKLLTSFAAGQGTAQMMQMLSGFLLIRWLSMEEYAQYSIALAFQSTAQNLVGVGFSGALIALVGNRIHEKKTIGEYIKAGKFFRNRFFVLVSCLCMIAFPLITKQHKWPMHVTVLLLVSIVSSLYFSGNTAYYAAPLKMHRKINDLYTPKLKSGTARLSLIGILHWTSFINAWVAAMLTSLTIWYEGRTYKQSAAPHVIEPKHSSATTRTEMVRYIRPVVPGIVYASFSSQISLYIIGIFGNSQNIAEVGALGRIGQLFFILNTASAILVAPYFAKQAKDRLLSKYLVVISMAAAFAFLICTVTFLLPDPILWILGSNYSHLKTEVGLLVLNASIIFINVVMWDMNCSRKWLWSWIPAVSISTNIILQIFLVAFLDLTTTYNVLVYSIILSTANLFDKVLVAIIGFNK